MSLQIASNRNSQNQRELRLRQAVANLDRERREIGNIQRSLLPENLPAILGQELSAFYRPSERAGGDYYDVVPLAQDRWGFVMADVAGHGTPAAVIMAVLRTLIHANLPDTRSKSPEEFLQHVNGVMCRDYLREGRFITVWAAGLNARTRELTYVSAGHCPPRLVRRGTVIGLDKAHGLPIGIEPDSLYESHTITLEPEDLLVIYTDGITEASRAVPDGRDWFGTRRLDRLLARCNAADASDCRDQIMSGIETFTGGGSPADDQTMLIMRCTV